MAKQLVVLKSFLESYYDNMIEKSTTHKYIRRVPKSTGKGYNYFYPEDFKKPMKALLSFFGMKEDTIDKAYKNNNIQQSYGASKQNFAQHVLEYLTNRKTWNTFFANKANRDKYKVPEKPETKEKVEVKEQVIEGGKTKEKVAVEVKETKEKNFKSSWNRSLMRKIYSMYNKVPEDTIENKAGIDSIKVGDKVSYNGRVGTVTKDFENGMMFVNFENGGMGRFAVKDLQKMDVTADEVTESSELNAAEQEVNGTNEAIQEEIKEDVKVQLRPYIETGYQKYEVMGTDYVIKEGTDRDRNVLFTLLNQNRRDENNNMFQVNGFKTLEDAKNFVEAILNGKEPEKKLRMENGVYIENYGVSKEENEKPGYNKVERAAITVLYQRIKKENPELRDYQIYEKIKETVPDLDKKGDLLKTMTMVKKLIFDKELVPDVVNYIQENEIKDTTALSQAMMGNQNARKYGNLSDEANEIIASQNLNVNENGVVQPSEENRQKSAEFWKKNENKNYKFQKDQYGNTYLIMDGLDEYFYDKEGNRVDGAAFVHQRTYHDEYIPEEPNITLRIPGGYSEPIYLTPEMKVAMESGNTEYQPVNTSYVKPEKETIIENFLDLQTEKEKDKFKLETYTMGKIYEMAKKTGIKLVPVSMFSNHGEIVSAVVPAGSTDYMNGDHVYLTKKKDKLFKEYIDYINENVEPTEPVKAEKTLEKWQKNFLSAAFMAMKKEDPTMADIWYIEKLKQKVPQLANLVTDWSEIIDNPDWEMTAEDIQKVRDFAQGKEAQEEIKNEAVEYYVSGDGMWINKYLRNPEQFEKENGKVSDEEKKIINDLREQTKTEKINEKVLYRAVDASAVFGDISDLEFENLRSRIAYDDNQKLIVENTQKLIDGAIGKTITEKGFMSTTKDKEIAENWNGYTGSNKDIVLELNIPDGMTGKDMAAYDVEGEEQKEVLLPDNVDYQIKEIVKGDNGTIVVKADVLGEHGNHIAMLGNQNARKDGLTQEEANSLEYYVQDAGYTYINDKLRGVDETPMEQHHIDAVNNIDNVIARNTVKEKNLYRGVGGNVIFPEMNPYEHRLMELYFSNKAAYDSLPNDNWFNGVKYSNAKDNVEKYINEINGKTFTDKGFVSTSKNIKDTNVFTDSHSNPVIIEFENIPENTHGVDLSQFKEGREFNSENEVLLHRDLNYKITGMKSFGGKVVLTAEIIPETEEEKTKNRSEAMLGNDNAAGSRGGAAKPQTNEQMKKEEKKLEKARTEAGLPKPPMYERTSTIDDTTWDPKSENYRFRDTGYIAGARKEQAALYITRSAKEGVRVNAKEVDWNGIEENPRTAEKLIVKSNIFGDVDWKELREKGMSGSAAFLIDRIYTSAGAKPDENSPEARHNYVIALNGLRDRFEDCKTVDDVLNTLSEIKDEIKGEYLEIKESPKYLEIQGKRKELRDIAYAKKAELDGLSEQGRKNYDVAYQKVVEKFIEKGKKEKKLRWNTRVSRYNIPKEYEEAFANETKDLYKNAYAPWEKAVEDFKAELKARGVPEEDFHYEVDSYRSDAVNGKSKMDISWYDLWKIMPEMKEFRKLGDELDKYIEGQKVVINKKNPLLEAWKTLGSKFINITQSDTFAQHRYDCRKGKYDDWSWAEKDVTVRVKKPSKEKKIFNFLVAETIERKGGRNFDISSTADLKKAFNLRDVQSGNWVLRDPESAEFHVRNAARAFADLADITGIPDDKISLNGRLAMAFGARGTGNAGGSTAMAHYEYEERVINLTKFKGGGCLGHEWFHAFDNLLTCAMGGDNASSIFLTNKYSNLTPATKSLVLEYLKYKNSNDWSAEYQRKKIARKLADKNFDVKQLEKPQTDLQIKVQNAFDDLVKAMTTGTTSIKSAVVYSDKDYKDMLYTMSDTNIKLQRDRDSAYNRSKPSLTVVIADAGSLGKAVDMINERYGDTTDKKLLKNKGEWIRLAAAYYDRNPSGNKLGNRLVVNSGKVGSQFLADAFDLDENGEHKDYWSTTHEMAARAFSAYIEDTLEEQGRKNDYLAYKSDNKWYDGGKPYPEGEERKRINAAFKKLFEVVRENNAIEKAVSILDKPDFIIKGGRFLIRK